MGIDLGTSNCSVGVMVDGQVVIVENEYGMKTTPSYIAFTEKGRLFGRNAKSKVNLHFKQTLYGFKPLIGRKFKDPLVHMKDYSDRFACTLVERNEAPAFALEGSVQATLCPEQLSAMMLKKMQLLAKERLGFLVKDAVIAVPCYYTREKIHLARKVAEIAGINVLSFIYDTAAVACAYIHENKTIENEIDVIVDMGAGGLSISVTAFENGRQVQKGVFGDDEFSGTQIDVDLMKHFEKEIEAEHGVKISERARERLRVKCEKLKEDLSVVDKGDLELENVINGEPFEASVSRDVIQSCVEVYLMNILRYKLTQLLQQLNLSKQQIKKVIISGGLTRIPFIQNFLSDFFDRSSLCKSVNPDEAVAYGATLRANEIVSRKCARNSSKNPTTQFQSIDYAEEAINEETFPLEDLKREVEKFDKKDAEFTAFYSVADQIQSFCSKIKTDFRSTTKYSFIPIYYREHIVNYSEYILAIDIPKCVTKEEIIGKATKLMCAIYYAMNLGTKRQ